MSSTKAAAATTTKKRARPADGTAVDESGSKKPRFERNVNGGNGSGSKEVRDGSKKTTYEKGGAGKKSRSAKGSNTGYGAKGNGDKQGKGKDMFINGKPPAANHREQRALATERRLSKPNADIIHRSKKIWERLRRKSHVPPEERAELVAELFEILNGRVADFVFKHDSVRVVQCAVKYGSKQQKVGIAEELRGRYRELAESRYAKFLVGKLVVVDDSVRDLVVAEFRGAVKRLVRGAESGWILDDVYRGAATPAQKALLLREWYGPSVGLLDGTEGDLGTTGDLSVILKAKPELRGPVMQHLKESTNQLIQTKKTGFTMLHDALWEYFRNCVTSGPEEREIMDMLRDDEDGDLVRNLAFTSSGAKLLCLCIAAGDAKYRRGILSHLKSHIRAMAADNNGMRVLLTAMECLDDTREIAKTLFRELLCKDQPDDTLRNQELLAQLTHLVARVPLLWPFNAVGNQPKWLTLPNAAQDLELLEQVRERRSATSKKDPEKRRGELVEALSQPLLDFIAASAADLVQSGYGCQAFTEILLNSVGEKEKALEAVAALATNAENDEEGGLLNTPQAGRMLKTLVSGGQFDKVTNTVKQVDPPLKFGEKLYDAIVNTATANEKKGEEKNKIVQWAKGPNSFSILAMLEAADFGRKEELRGVLMENEEELREVEAENAGARKILEAIGASKEQEVDALVKAEKPRTKKETGDKFDKGKKGGKEKKAKK